MWERLGQCSIPYLISYLSSLQHLRFLAASFISRPLQHLKSSILVATVSCSFLPHLPSLLHLCSFHTCSISSFLQHPSSSISHPCSISGFLQHPHLTVLQHPSPSPILSAYLISHSCSILHLPSSITAALSLPFPQHPSYPCSISPVPSLQQFPPISYPYSIIPQLSLPFLQHLSYLYSISHLPSLQHPPISHL